ncbi:MAG TPA: nuclear transport factor 2 family protein, partial [Kofleriaceae bacterium]|nr:nuclear transport factor 2 family protein [Kofleriaceae bacterium]
MKRIAIAVLVWLPGLAAAAPAETAATADAVKAIEAHWSRAFLTGDAAYLDALLDDSYVSVGETGAVHDKAAVVGMAKKNAGKTMPTFPQPAEAIALRGTTAIVTFAGDSERSADVFYFADGRW